MRMRPLAARFASNASFGYRIGQQSFYADVAAEFGTIVNLVVVNATSHFCNQAQFVSMALGERAVYGAQFIGNGLLAKIMNFTKVELESSILQGVGQIDEELALRIQDNMFSFENLTSVDNRGIQALMRAVEPDLLMIALKGATEEVKTKFLDNMSSRARGMFLDDMEAKGPLRMTEVEDAQKKVMRAARKLSEKGELILASGGADFV